MIDQDQFRTRLSQAESTFGIWHDAARLLEKAAREESDPVKVHEAVRAFECASSALSEAMDRVRRPFAPLADVAAKYAQAAQYMAKLRPDLNGPTAQPNAVTEAAGRIREALIASDPYATMLDEPTAPQHVTH